MKTNNTNAVFSKEKNQVAMVQDLTFQVLSLLEKQGLTVGMARFILKKAIYALDKSRMQAVKPDKDRYVDYIDRNFD